VLFVLLSLVAGCQFFSPMSATPLATDAQSAAVNPPVTTTVPASNSTTGAGTPLAPGASSAGTLAPTNDAESTPSAPQTLTVWISERIGPLSQGRSLDVLEQQFVAFEATHPGLTIDVAIKGTAGAGRLENLLTTASAVAPTVLPDLVALDTGTVRRLALKGLTVPLEDRISTVLYQDLYGLAQQSTLVQGRWMGVQFQARGLEHAIYNPNKIAVAPLTWTEVYSSGATYVFPAAGQEGLINDAFLIQYLSTGASLVDEAGEPALDREALTNVLGFYRQGIERGSILTDVIEYATVEQSWPRFLQAEVVLCNISSDLYLSVKTGEPTGVPTRDGQAIILSRGDAWALTARDPGRQLLAGKLIEWLLNPINMATWSQAAGTLPTRRAALLEMPRDPYVTFMYTQLETARPFPTSETHLRIYRAMQQAVDAVLREGLAPEIAAENILKAVNQETS
jgi:ABC-type glycerol-3-phosphate transport system substrate-binding protein